MTSVCPFGVFRPLFSTPLSRLCELYRGGQFGGEGNNKSPNSYKAVSKYTTHRFEIELTT